MPHSTATPAPLNQSPPLGDYNLFATDLALQHAAQGTAHAELRAAGAQLGRADLAEQGRLANRHGPVLKSLDPRGVRIEHIEFHPAWHVLMQGIAARGYHSGPWADQAAGGSMTHAARAAGYLMQAQVECGSLCPTTMTYGAIAAMRRDAWLAREWVPKLLARRYDPQDVPLAAKSGGLIGMGMTEKQGGSDVRANTTQAQVTADGSYRINGHKWFFSAPQCDAHLVLAQSSHGLSCFFMPRRLPDGTLNGIFIQRLKDKLGNRSNASAEVEFIDAWGHLLGEPGRGIPTILEMGTYTRLDCVTGSAGMMRQAVVQAIHHARHRRVFGRSLIEQPLMAGVLADLAVESEAATHLALRVARAYDSDAAHEVALRRALTPAAKFWVCKRGCELAAEAMEVLGGNGYTEDFPLARIAREMPVNSIWEGSGNIMCLDVLRAFTKSAASRDAAVHELTATLGLNRRFDQAFERFRGLLSGDLSERQARHISQLFVTLVQAKLLLRAANDAAGPAAAVERITSAGADSGAGAGAGAMAEAFCATRLDPQAGWGAVFGAGAAAMDGSAILNRAWA